MGKSPAPITPPLQSPLPRIVVIPQTSTQRRINKYFGFVNDARIVAERTEEARYVRKIQSTAPDDLARVFQTSLIGSHLIPFLSRVLQSEEPWNPLEFFLNTIWEHAGRGVQPFEHQLDMLGELTNLEHHMMTEHFTSGSVCFNASTGAGKSIVMEYALFLAFQYGRDRSCCVQGARTYTTILAYPTTMLCQESFTRISLAYTNYTYAYTSLVYDTNGVLDLSRARKLPEGRHTKDIDKGMVVFPHNKMVAGSVGKANLYINRKAVDNFQGDPGREKIVNGYFATYEQALTLFHNFRISQRGWSRRQMDDSVADEDPDTEVMRNVVCVCIDEAHYLTNSDRTSALALALWCKRLDFPVIFTTGTYTGELDSWMQHYHIRTINVRVHRPIPHAGLILDGFATEFDLLYGMVDVLFGAYLTAVRSNYKVRTALFIENKILLKILLTMLCHRVRQRAPALLEGRRLEFTEPMYEHLRAAIARDVYLQADTTRYGALVDPVTYTMEFAGVLIEAANLGILLIMADCSSNVKHLLSSIASNKRCRFTIVLATTAIGEGCNLVNIGILLFATTLGQPRQDGSRRSLVPSVKAMQVVGRAGREGKGDIVLVMPESQCRLEVYNMLPILILYDIIGYSQRLADVQLIWVENGMNYVIITFTTFTTFNLRWIYDEAGDDVLEDFQTRIPVITGYEYIPYYAMDMIFRIPAFRIRDNAGIPMIEPCFMTRILRLFHDNNHHHFNLCVFALGKKEIKLLMQLPCVVVLGIIVLYLGFRPWFAQPNSLKEKKSLLFNQFIAEKETSLANRPGLSELRQEIQRCLSAIGKHLKDCYHVPENWPSNDWQIYPWLPQKKMLTAIPIFLTEIAVATCSWDVICAEYSIYDDTFAGFMGKFDLLMNIAVEPTHVLPYRDAQIELSNKWSNAYEGEDVQDIMEANELNKTILASDDYVMSVYSENHIDRVWGMSVPENKRLFGTGLLVREREVAQRAQNIAENAILRLIIYTSHHIARSFQFLEKTTTTTFSDVRQSFARPTQIIRLAQLLDVDMPLYHDEDPLHKRLLRPMALDYFYRMPRYPVMPEDEKLINRWKEIHPDTSKSK